MKTQTFEIPTLNFTKGDYNKKTKEIIINLNNFRWLDEIINSYQKSHRRLIPQINLVSPSGVIVNFSYPRMDKWEIVFEGKKCNVRLTYI